MSLQTLSMKEKLSQKQLIMAQTEFEKAKKSKLTGYLLWFFTGMLGGHRFYSRDTLYAIGMLLTLGGLGFWTLIDVFFIGRRIEALNEEIEANILRDIAIFVREEPQSQVTLDQPTLTSMPTKD